MYCQKCGASIPSGHRLCECDAEFVICPSCRFANNPDANFCGGCGFALPIAREEIKRVTVLFADIQGSTELIQQQDPEKVKAILSPVIGIMTAAAERYGGRVEDPVGDGIKANFGAPHALEDHAVRACLAAVSLQDSVRRWNAAQGDSDSPRQFHVRIGLSSGDVVTTGRDKDGLYGEANFIASRLEGLAAPGRILLTKSTWLLARGFVRAVSLGPKVVRGRRTPIEVFELEGVEARTRFDARQNQGLTHFVGRDAELDLLENALRSAEAGDGQVVTVTGDPGVGKSRLIHHFLHVRVPRATTILETSAEPYDRDSVNLPIVSLLRSELSLLPGDPPALIRERLASRLSARPELLEAVSALLDVSESTKSDTWRDLDPRHKLRRIGEAVRELILMTDRPSALVLVIEDLQWLDENTAGIVAELIDQVRGRRVLMLLSSRDEVATQGDHSSVLALGALEGARAEELITHLVGDSPDIELLRDVLFRRTEDRPTPLFLEETVSSLIERGVLQGKPGSYCLNGDLEALETDIPHKVEEVIAVRIDRLGPEERNVLATSAAIGMEAPRELLEAVTGFDKERLPQILCDLESADLMYESLSSGRPEFRFKHTLTREAAVARIPPRKRQDLHARTAAAIEGLYGRRDEWIDRLAYHALRANLPDKAYWCLADACQRAIDRSANRHAVTLFEKGLSVLRELADNDERTRRAIDVRLMVLNALLPLGEQERLGQLLLEAKDLAVSASDTHRLAKVEVALTLFLWEAGSHQQALESGATALRLATEHSLDHVSQAARLQIGIVYHELGEFRQTVALHGAVLQQLAAAGLEKKRFKYAAYPGIVARAFSVDSCLSLGAFDQAARLMREGDTLADEIGHPYSRALIDTVMGRYHLACDDPHTATQIFEQAEHRCREDEVHAMLPVVVAGLGTALARSGRAWQAVRLLQDAIDAGTYLRAGNPGLYYLRAALGEARGLAGQTDVALGDIEEAEQLARRNGEMAHVAQAIYIRAGLLSSRDTAAAETAYLDARRRAEALEMRPLAAACWLGLAEVERRLGRPEAPLTLNRARTLMAEIGLMPRAQQAPAAPA